MTVRVGTILYGYCNGYFGRDSYGDKRIEAIGRNWIVARNLNDEGLAFARIDASEMDSLVAKWSAE